MAEQGTLHAGVFHGNARRKITNFVLWFLVGMVMSGCAAQSRPKYTDVSLTLQADAPINDGVLLPIDVIAVNESKADSVLAVSPDEWFGNDMRERLTSEEIQKFAIKDGGSRTIDVRVPSEVGRIIIYADYENTSERERQQIIIFPGKDRFKRNYSIRIQKNRLELTQ